MHSHVSTERDLLDPGADIPYFVFCFVGGGSNPSLERSETARRLPAWVASMVGRERCCCAAAPRSKRAAVTFL
jgi:hypothetical protein